VKLIACKIQKINLENTPRILPTTQVPCTVAKDEKSQKRRR
jgi:hypothetical protein